MKRDSDGFIILQRVAKPGRPNGDMARYMQKKYHKKKEDTIGEYQLKKVDKNIRLHSTTKGRISIPISDQYEISQTVKSWQRKAWDALPRLNWSVKGPLHGSIGIKLSHVKAISGYMRVVVSVKDESQKDVIDEISGKRKYMTAVTKSDIENFINIWHSKLFVSSYEYMSYAENNGYDQLDIIAKVLIVYDDKSYDVFCGNAFKLFEILQPKFVNGRVKL